RQEQGVPDEHEDAGRACDDIVQWGRLEMFVSKKHIPRRTFLRGAGMALGLPLLDSMIPAATALAQTVAAKRPQRFVGVFFPHGMAPGWWAPEKEGALPEGKLPLILESLKPVQD